MRKSLIFALLTLFTLSMVMVSCDNNNDDPNPPENGGNYIECTCHNLYIITGNPTQFADWFHVTKKQPEYKVYASGGALYVGFLTLVGQGLRTDKDCPPAPDLTLEKLEKDYPFVTYYEEYESYYFWRCECGRYHKVMMNTLTHTEIPAGDQPDEWNKFNYLWE